MQRAEAIQTVKDSIVAAMGLRPFRVGIDGVDCAGKTALANELAAALREDGTVVIRASIDDFHQPRAIRYRQGRGSPLGYYEDSFDVTAVCANLLVPLGAAGDGWYRTAVFDHHTDQPLDSTWQRAPDSCVLLFDGIFLHRPELLPHLDFTLFVAADFAVTIARAFERDRPLFQSVEEVKQMYELRYIPGQQLYFAACRPLEKANVIFHNNNLQNPVVILQNQCESTSGKQEFE